MRNIIAPCRVTSFVMLILLMSIATLTYALPPTQKVIVSTTWTNTTACTGTAGVSGSATFLVSDGCTPSTNYCKTCIMGSGTFRLWRMYPTNASTPVLVSSQAFSNTSLASSVPYSFPTQIATTGFYYVDVTITFSNGVYVGGGTTTSCVASTGSPVGGTSTGLQYYNIGPAPAISSLISPTIDGLTMSTNIATYTPICFSNGIINSIGGFSGGFGPNGCFANDPNGKWSVSVQQVSSGTSFASSVMNPFNDGIYTFDLRGFIVSKFSGAAGQYKVTVTVQNPCASSSTTYYVNTGLVINGGLLSPTVPTDVCGAVVLTGSFSPYGGLQYRYTITEATSTGTPTGTPFVYGPTTTPVSNLSGISGSPLAVVANVNKYYLIKVEVSNSGTFTPVTTVSGLIHLLGVLSGNYDIGYYNTSSVWVSDGTAGNAICSPITTCEAQLNIGHASGTSSGSLTGVKFKLEQLTSACNAPTPTWTTIFDGTYHPAASTVVYPIWSFGGTAWSQLNANLATYCNATDIAEAAAAGITNPHELRNNFSNGYLFANPGTEFKLTAYIYNSACTTTYLTQVAYILNNNGACKTNGGAETETALDPAISDADAFSVYPVPASGVLHVALSGSYQDAMVSLYDLQGREIVVPMQKTNNGNATLDVSGLSKGVYILGLNGQKVSKRILID